MKRRFDHETVESTSWGKDFLQEVGYVIAASVQEEMLTGKTLYNDEINARVVDFCMPLCPEVQDNYLGVIHVAPNNEAPYKRLDAATEQVSQQPLGSWAVLEMDGKYDAMMSNGVGAAVSAPSINFMAESPHSTHFNVRNLLSAVVSWLVYNERNRIQNAITEHSAEVAGIEPGTIAKDQWINSKLYSKVEFLRVDPDHFVGSNAYRVKATRRGVRPSEFILTAERFMSIYGIPPTLPDHLMPKDGIDRTRSLTEKRLVAAQTAWEDYDRINAPEVALFNTSGPFIAQGDRLERTVYSPSEKYRPAGVFSVTFEPHTDTVSDCDLEMDVPTLTMR